MLQSEFSGFNERITSTAVARHLRCYYGGMQIPMYQVDAFATALFEGNPAAVCVLQEWIDDALMQSIAMENNLSETAFVVADPEGHADYQIRWFTPTTEVNLCGHATLATGHVLLNMTHTSWDRVRLSSRSGPLTVSRHREGLELDFPAITATAGNPPDGLLEALGLSHGSVHAAGEDYLVRVPDEASVAALAPNFSALRQVEARGIMVTAPGEQVDFVSRFFAPQSGVNEDPVTGSAHCALAPYWAMELGRTSLRAKQLSSRSGIVHCEVDNDRVRLAGGTRQYLSGFLNLSSKPS